MPQDMTETLKNLLGNDAEEKIQTVLSAFNSGNTSETEPAKAPDSPPAPTLPSVNPETLQYISKIKGVVDEIGKANDARSNLLMSLKPYMRSDRQKSIDNAIRILNISKLSGIFRQ